MRWVLLATILIGTVGTMYTLFRPGDATVLARHLCGAAVERFTGYEINANRVAAIDVSGNVLAGTVRLSFDAAGQRHNAKCIFDGGAARRVKLDGKLLFGS